MKLLGIDTNGKTIKGQKKGYMTGILYLAPANISGHEVCAKRSAGCTVSCLYSAGRGAFTNVQKARIAKTKWFFDNRETFMVQLVDDIRAVIRKADREDMIPVVRLNGTSDIPWERIPVMGKKNVMELFPDVQFYDYTKRSNRKNLPSNYHLTFSLAEDNDADAEIALQNNMNVAIVFRTVNFPASFEGREVVDGDETDLRFLDGHGKIIALKAKGKAKKDFTGFVREVFETSLRSLQIAA